MFDRVASFVDRRWRLLIGLAWMVFATLFPLGLLQLERSVSVGYFEARDLPVIRAAVLVLAVFIVVINLAVDVMYTVLDPRIRLESSR